MATKELAMNLGKDTMTMQDRANANHDLGKDAKINNVLDKGSMAANPFFGNSQCSTFFLRRYSLSPETLFPKSLKTKYEKQQISI